MKYHTTNKKERRSDSIRNRWIKYLFQTQNLYYQTILKEKIIKRIFITIILIACFVAIAGMHGYAQTSYAKVTVYTNSQQYVSGTLNLVRLLPTPVTTIWSMSFSFQANEGQIVDGGYMYQKWILLAYSIPQTGTLYELMETAYGESVHSHSYAPLDWPLYVLLPGNDFRSQGGQ